MTLEYFYENKAHHLIVTVFILRYLMIDASYVLNVVVITIFEYQAYARNVSVTLLFEGLLVASAPGTLHIKYIRQHMTR